MNSTRSSLSISFPGPVVLQGLKFLYLVIVSVVCELEKRVNMTVAQSRYCAYDGIMRCKDLRGGAADVQMSGDEGHRGYEWGRGGRGGGNDLTECKH